MEMNKDREIIAAATPGPWFLEEGSLFLDNGTHMGNFFSDDADADYIAHFNPSHLTEILDDRDALRERVEELENVIKQSMADDQLLADLEDK